MCVQGKLTVCMCGRFFAEPDTSCAWELVSAVRSNYVDPQDFDDMIFSRLTLLTDNPDGRSFMQLFKKEKFYAI